MKRMSVISLGEVLWDLFPEEERFGGAPANFACHAALLGGHVTLVSGVGEDERGRKAIRILQQFGIDVSFLQVVPDVPTGTVGIVLDDARRPTYSIHENSAWDWIEWTEELNSRIMAADAVCFGTLGQRSEASRNTIRRCVDAARSAGIPRIVDINLRPPFYDDAMIRDSLQLASILKLSDEELEAVCIACGVKSTGQCESMLLRLRETQSLDSVVMTRGPDGAILVTAEAVIEQPGVPVSVVDTVGAGDSFTAAFVLGMLRGEPYHQILQKACAVAADVCTHTGAVRMPLPVPPDDDLPRTGDLSA